MASEALSTLLAPVEANLLSDDVSDIPLFSPKLWTAVGERAGRMPVSPKHLRQLYARMDGVLRALLAREELHAALAEESEAAQPFQPRALLAALGRLLHNVSTALDEVGATQSRAPSLPAVLRAVDEDGFPLDAVVGGSWGGEAVSAGQDWADWAPRVEDLLAMLHPLVLCLDTVGFPDYATLLLTGEGGSSGSAVQLVAGVLSLLRGVVEQAQAAKRNMSTWTASAKPDGASPLLCLLTLRDRALCVLRHFVSTLGERAALEVPGCEARRLYDQAASLPALRTLADIVKAAEGITEQVLFRSSGDGGSASPLSDAYLGCIREGLLFAQVAVLVEGRFAAAARDGQARITGSQGEEEGEEPKAKRGGGASSTPSAPAPASTSTPLYRLPVVTQERALFEALYSATAESATDGAEGSVDSAAAPPVCLRALPFLFASFIRRRRQGGEGAGAAPLAPALSATPAASSQQGAGKRGRDGAGAGKGGKGPSTEAPPEAMSAVASLRAFAEFALLVQFLCVALGYRPAAEAASLGQAVMSADMGSGKLLAARASAVAALLAVSAECGVYNPHSDTSPHVQTAVLCALGKWAHARLQDAASRTGGPDALQGRSVQLLPCFTSDDARTGLYVTSQALCAVVTVVTELCPAAGEGDLSALLRLVAALQLPLPMGSVLSSFMSAPLRIEPSVRPYTSTYYRPPVLPSLTAAGLEVAEDGGSDESSEEDGGDGTQESAADMEISNIDDEDEEEEEEDEDEEMDTAGGNDEKGVSAKEERAADEDEEEEKQGEEEEATGEGGTPQRSKSKKERGTALSGGVRFSPVAMDGVVESVLLSSPTGFLWPVRPTGLAYYLTDSEERPPVAQPNLLGAMLAHLIGVHSRIRQLPDLLTAVVAEAAGFPMRVTALQLTDASRPYWKTSKVGSTEHTPGHVWSLPLSLEWGHRHMLLDGVILASVVAMSVATAEAGDKSSTGRAGKDKGKGKGKSKGKDEGTDDSLQSKSARLIESLRSDIEGVIIKMRAEAEGVLNAEAARVFMQYQAGLAFHTGLGSGAVLTAFAEALRALPPGQLWELASSLARDATELTAGLQTGVGNLYDCIVATPQDVAEHTAVLLREACTGMGKSIVEILGKQAFTEAIMFCAEPASVGRELSMRWLGSGVLRLHAIVLLLAEYLRHLRVTAGAGSAGKAVHLAVQLSYGVTLRCFQMFEAMNDEDGSLEFAFPGCGLIMHTLLACAGELHAACTDVALAATSFDPVRQGVPTLFPPVSDPSIRGQEEVAPHSALLASDAMWPMAALLPVARTYGPVDVPAKPVPEPTGEDDDSDEESEAEASAPAADDVEMAGEGDDAGLQRPAYPSFYILRLVRHVLPLRRPRRVQGPSVTTFPGSAWAPLPAAREAMLRLAVSRAHALHSSLALLAAQQGLAGPGMLPSNIMGMQSIQGLLGTVLRYGGPQAVGLLELASVYLPGPVLRAFFDQLLEPAAFEVDRAVQHEAAQQSEWRIELLRDARLYAIPALARQVGPALFERIQEARERLLLNFSVEVPKGSRKKQGTLMTTTHAIIVAGSLVSSLLHGSESVTQRGERVARIAKHAGVDVKTATKQLKFQDDSNWFISAESTPSAVCDLQQLRGLLELAAHLPAASFAYEGVVPRPGQDEVRGEAAQDGSDSTEEDDKPVQGAGDRSDRGVGRHSLQLCRKKPAGEGGGASALPSPTDSKTNTSLCGTVPSLNPAEVSTLLHGCFLLCASITCNPAALEGEEEGGGAGDRLGYAEEVATFHRALQHTLLSTLDAFSAMTVCPGFLPALAMQEGPSAVASLCQLVIFSLKLVVQVGQSGAAATLEGARRALRRAAAHYLTANAVRSLAAAADAGDPSSAAKRKSKDRASLGKVAAAGGESDKAVRKAITASCTAAVATLVARMGNVDGPAAAVALLGRGGGVKEHGDITSLVPNPEPTDVLIAVALALPGLSPSLSKSQAKAACKGWVTALASILFTTRPGEGHTTADLVTPILFTTRPGEGHTTADAASPVSMLALEAACGLLEGGGSSGAEEAVGVLHFTLSHFVTPFLTAVSEQPCARAVQWLTPLANALGAARRCELASYAPGSYRALTDLLASAAGLRALAAVADATADDVSAQEDTKLAAVSLHKVLQHVPAAALVTLVQSARASAVSAMTGGGGVRGLTSTLHICRAVLDAAAAAHDTRHFAEAEEAAAADVAEGVAPILQPTLSFPFASPVEAVLVVSDASARDALLSFARGVLPIAAQTLAAMALTAQDGDVAFAGLSVLRSIAFHARLLPLRSPEVQQVVEGLACVHSAMAQLQAFRPVLRSYGGGGAVAPATTAASLGVDAMDVDVARGYGGEPDDSHAPVPVTVSCGTAALALLLGAAPACEEVGAAATPARDGVQLPLPTALPSFSGAAFSCAAMTVHAVVRFHRDDALIALQAVSSTVQALTSLALLPMPGVDGVPADTLSSLGRCSDGYYASPFLLSLTRGMESLPRLLRVARYTAVHMVSRYCSLASVRRAPSPLQRAQLSAAEAVGGIAVPSRVRDVLRPGAFALLDVCRAAELQAIHTALGALSGSSAHSARALLKSLHKEYEREHKYTGKA